MINNQNQQTPFQDALYQIGRNALRQANTAVLPHALKKLQRKIESKANTDYMEAELRIIYADIARTLDRDGTALDMAELVINHPPGANGLDILSRAQRLQVSLYLDDGDVERARTLAQGIDALVIVNSEARGGEQVFSRRDSDIAVETLLLQSEIALFTAENAEAGEFLIAAAKRLATMEIENSAKKLSSFQTRQSSIFCMELRYKLHFWEAALRIAGGDEEGFAMLISLAEQIVGNTQADRRILSRIKAMLGEFDIEKSAPVGIGRREAMRLFALATHKVVSLAKQDFEDADNLLEVETMNLLDLKPSPENLMQISLSSEMAIAGQKGNYHPWQISSAIEKLSDSQIATNMQMAAMFEQIKDVLGKMPVQSTALAIQQKRRPFAFGGGFAFFDLATQLGSAEAVKFTGFFQCQWSPDMVETTILSGNLDPLARHGEGFVFMKNGTIIDATIGSYDPPEEFAPDSPEAEADAKRALTVLIQVGIGQKLDCLPDGFGEGYASAAVKERKPRLKYNQIKLAMLIQERDEELA